MIHHTVREFSKYSYSLLPTTTYTPFVGDVNEIFDAMLVEMDFRESSPTTVESYMKIRKVTIAISPFFTLLEGSVDLDFKSDALAELKELLKEACGLQNDLIGLDKDIQTGWPMNVIMVLRELDMKQLLVRGLEEEEAQIMRQSVKEACDMHNEAVGKAVERWEAIRASNMKSEKQLSDLMMVFMNRHFQWAIVSKRYK